MYYISYFIFILSFVIIFLLKGTIVGTYIFGASYGLGFGAFWCAVNTNELTNIKDKESVFFPSMLLREIIINPARILMLLISIFLANIYGNNLEFLLKLLLIVSGIMYLMTWFTIKMHIINENHDNLENLL